MQAKPLLYGLIGFILGGLVVSLAATNLDTPANDEQQQTSTVSMEEMTADLKNKTGDAYDKAFINHMIEHHQAAVDMARLSATNAKHEEIKTLSKAIITAQEKEINDMQQWRNLWGYDSSQTGHSAR